MESDDNLILMDTIAKLLSDKDLVALCLTSKTTKKIVDQMDSSCWRKRANILEAVLTLEATDRTSSKERYLFLKPKVERLALTIRRKIEDNMGVIQVRPSVSFRPATHEEESQFMSLQELTNTASLVHHGIWHARRSEL